MKTVNLRNKLEGHIVLWAKNHYGERTLERLAEIQREWSGMPSDWTPHAKDVFRFVREAADAVGVSGNLAVEMVVSGLWHQNNLPTTYHVRPESKITLEGIIQAYATAIQISIVKSENFEVLLPSLLPNMQYKYELERA